jgi:ABC-2 type transport system ATP-binding protein
MTCSKVAIINRGRVVATNTPEQLVAALSGGNGYELEVEGNFEQVQLPLQQVRGVKAIDVTTDETLGENRYRIRLSLEPNHDPGRDIAALIVGSGLGLYEMRRTRVSLEDVFLELTTEEKTIDLDGMAQAYERAQAEPTHSGNSPDQPIDQSTDNPDSPEGGVA